MPTLTLLPSLLPWIYFVFGTESTGTGLAECRRLCSRQGGELSVPRQGRASCVIRRELESMCIKVKYVALSTLRPSPSPLSLFLENTTTQAKEGTK